MKDKNQTPKIKVVQPFQSVGKRLREIRESLKKNAGGYVVAPGRVASHASKL